MAFKLLVLAKHYRTEGNFTWDNLEAAQRRLNHWYDYAALRHQIHASLESDHARATSDDGLSFFSATHALVEALENNLDTPGATTLVDDVFAQIDRTPIDSLHRRSFIEFLQTIDELLGLDLIEKTPDISDNAKQLIIARERARDAKQWQRSDELRDELAEQGITLRDTPSGTIWTILT